MQARKGPLIEMNRLRLVTLFTGASMRARDRKNTNNSRVSNQGHIKRTSQISISSLALTSRKCFLSFSGCHHQFWTPPHFLCFGSHVLSTLSYVFVPLPARSYDDPQTFAQPNSLCQLGWLLLATFLITSN